MIFPKNFLNFRFDTIEKQSIINLSCYRVKSCACVVLNTPQSTNYTATYLPSRKLSKLDKPDTQDTAGEAETSS